MTAPTTDANVTRGRKPLVVNQEVIQTRFDIFANSISEVSTGQDMIATTRIAISNLPADKQTKIVAMLAGGIGAANKEGWKQFAFLMNRLATKVNRQSDDAVISELQYDVMEKLLPIIMELYGTGSDEVEDDSEV